MIRARLVPVTRGALHLLFLLLLQHGLLLAQDDSNAEEEPASQKPPSPLRKLMDESLSWEELFADENSATPMEPRVALRWTNNTRGSEDGMTVLFLAHGRPEAVCCIYPWERKLVHEYDSLSRGTLIAKRDGVVEWDPEKAGVQFQAVPEADPPAAESRAARLRQMKSLARQFASTMLGWRADSSDREELRLLPRPLYRYEGNLSPSLLDGAVFAFVQGTDPESLLLLEAVEVSGRLEWQFAFARRTSGELEGRHQGRIVWHADRFPPNDDRRSTHRVLSRPLDDNVLSEASGNDESP